MVLAGEIQQTHRMTLKWGRRLVSYWAGKGCSLAGVAGKGLSGETHLALSSQSFREPFGEGLTSHSESRVKAIACTKAQRGGCPWNVPERQRGRVAGVNRWLGVWRVNFTETNGRVSSFAGQGDGC